MIIGRLGDQALPISVMSVSRKHCEVWDNGDGTYTIENLSNFGTKVDGRTIIKTTSATLDSLLELGPEFKARLRDLIVPRVREPEVSVDVHIEPGNAKGGKADGNEPKTYNIYHLKKVWDDYNNRNLYNAERQRKINLMRTGLGVFTMCAMPTIFFLGPIGYVLTGIGVVGNIYSFAGMRNSETAIQKQKRQEAFDDAWVCPNPKCGRTLPAKNYRMLVKNNKSCPYCKCKYIERK